MHTLAITSGNQLWVWGKNNYGQLGDNTAVNKSSPIQIASAKSWSSVVGGYSHTLAVTTGNQLWTWGNNNNGRLSDNTGVSKSSPIQIASEQKLVICRMRRVQSIAAGAALSAAVAPPRAQAADKRTVAAAKPSMSAFVFEIQANMDPHRAFVVIFGEHCPNSR